MISTKNVKGYENLSEEEKKGFLPVIITRWLSGTRNPTQIIYINELVNPFVFSLYKHPQLLYNLMTLCGPNKPQRYHWNKTVSSKATNFPTAVSLIREHYGYNTRQALEVLPLLSNDDIMEYAEDLGLQKDDITKLKKELKSR